MQKLWKDCVDWLVLSGVLDDVAGQQMRKPADLAVILRDGVLLCELALKLAPGCIDRNEMFLQYEENQRSPFMRAKNILLFLNACQREFRLTTLFNGDDLYDLEDFGRVLQVLSLLSHTPQAIHAGLSPFSKISQPIAPIENSIYCNLRDEVDKCCDPARLIHFSRRGEQNNSIEGDVNDSRKRLIVDDDEDHYGFIGTLHDDKSQREKLYDTIVTRGGTSNTTVSKYSIPQRYLDYKPTNKRGHCIRELLDTESRYCDMLDMFIENFYNKMRFRLEVDDFNTIFINIKDIQQLHKRFVSKLVPAVLDALGLGHEEVDMANGAEQKFKTKLQRDSERLHIADVFLMFKLEFVPYAHYCSALKSSARRIDELERAKPDIRKYIAELSSQTQFNLRDLLAVPFQRLLKYPLILKELMGATSSDVDEFTRFDAAHEAMRDVSNYCNEMKRDQEKNEVIKTIENSILNPGDTTLPTPFIEWCGRLMQDGAVKLIDPEGTGSLRKCERYIFLFEKNLIACKQRNNGFYEFRKAYIISDFELTDGDGDHTSNSSTSTSRGSTISRKLTSTFFDNTSLTLTRRGYASLLGQQLGNTTSANITDSHHNRGASSDAASSTGTLLDAKRVSQSSLGAYAFVQILFKSASQRDEWRKEFRKAIELNNPPIAAERGHSLLYKTYTHVTECSICRKFLSGQFYQGYHCSGCGYDIHFKCCKNLQYCPARRRPPACMPPSSSPHGATAVALHRKASGGAADLHHSRTRSHSAIHFFSPINRFQPGDLVVATRTVVSSIGDTSRLSFNVRDILEIVDIQNDSGLITARLNNRPERVGVVSPDCIERTSDTLRKDAERIRHSTNVLHDVAGDPNTSNATAFAPIFSPSIALSGSGGNADSAPLVSRKIITLSEEAGVTDLIKQPWFFGSMDRAEAAQLLERTEDGTFLVRYSSFSGIYAISIQKGGRSKHLRIVFYQDSGQYCVYDGRLFGTISDLIAYYRRNSLREAFLDLNLVLGGTPLKANTFLALNIYDRQSENYLTLRPGDIVTVLQTCAEQQGWWVGRIDDRIGFFPVSYVTEIPKDDENLVVDFQDANSSDSSKTITGSIGYSYTTNGARHDIHAQSSSSPHLLVGSDCISMTNSMVSVQNRNELPTIRHSQQQQTKQFALGPDCRLSHAQMQNTSSERAFSRQNVSLMTQSDFNSTIRSPQLYNSSTTLRQTTRFPSSSPTRPVTLQSTPQQLQDERHIAMVQNEMKKLYLQKFILNNMQNYKTNVKSEENRRKSDTSFSMNIENARSLVETHFSSPVDDYESTSEKTQSTMPRLYPDKELNCNRAVSHEMNGFNTSNCEQTPIKTRTLDEPYYANRTTTSSTEDKANVSTV